MYLQVPALEHKNTLTFLNNFVIHTTQFLNKFSNVCEEVRAHFQVFSHLQVCIIKFAFAQRLSELSRRIQRLDISLNILEAKVIMMQILSPQLWAELFAH